MDEDPGPWRDGLRAWERLSDRRRRATRHARDDGDEALAALNDIGQLRRLLEQAELEAVRIARRQAKSWAEIATRLGVTRQSAWERWRDLDEQPAPTTDEQPAPTTEAVTLAAGERRRSSSVSVPDVVGMPWATAGERLRDKGLVPVNSDPDAPPPLGAGWLVVDQSPESGAKVPAGSRVRLWVQRGEGGSGVREPRTPKPVPRAGRAMRDELSDEAVG